MLPGIRSLAVAMHLEIYWVYTSFALSFSCTITFMIAHSRHYRKNKW
ncbi:hypothetical protein [Photorhabdus australis]